MSGLDLTHNIKVPADIARALRGLGNFDWNDTADEIGSYLVSEVQQRFEDQTTVDGVDFTQSQAALNRQGLTLVDTGHLRDSYTYDAHGKAIDIGSNLDYAAIHHFGGMTGRGLQTELQANPVLGINADDESEIGNIIVDSFREAMRVL